MMKKLTFAIILLFTIGLVNAQEYKLGEKTKLYISGTSSLHDWTMDAGKVQGQGKFVVDNNQLTDIENLKIIIDAESLKSGKSGMDKNAYKALNTNKHKQITFVVSDVKNVSNGKITVDGKLTISGFTKNVTLTADYSVIGNKINVKGTLPVVMTEYKVDPPTAMFGTITTGDKIVVHFDAVFQQ